MALTFERQVTKLHVRVACSIALRNWGAGCGARGGYLWPSHRNLAHTQATELREVSKFANMQGMNWRVSYFSERVQREITE